MVKNTLHKKSIIFIIGFFVFIPFCKAQDLPRIRNLWEQKSLLHAKEAIDSFVQINGSNPEGWLLQSRIYNEISKSPELKDMVADGRMDAFQALQKAMQLNRSYTEWELNVYNYKLPLELYNGYTNEALTYYNAGVERNDKGSFTEALNRFKKAGLISSYIYKNGWGLSLTDTSNIYYSAKAAMAAGKEEDAVLFAKKIADAGIVQKQDSKGFESIYQWLAFYYKQNKDSKNFDTYVQSGMKYFSASVYFDLVTIDWLRQEKDYKKLFDAYQALIEKRPENKYRLAYLNDMFNYLYGRNTALTDRAFYEKTLSTGLVNYLKADRSSTEARLLLGKFYINQANDHKAVQQKLLARSNVYLKEIVNGNFDKSTVIYLQAVTLLITNYTRLNMPKEAIRYKKLLISGV